MKGDKPDLDLELEGLDLELKDLDPEGHKPGPWRVASPDPPSHPRPTFWKTFKLPQMS